MTRLSLTLFQWACIAVMLIVVGTLSDWALGFEHTTPRLVWDGPADGQYQVQVLRGQPVVCMTCHFPDVLWDDTTTQTYYDLDGCMLQSEPGAMRVPRVRRLDPETGEFSSWAYALDDPVIFCTGFPLAIDLN